MIHTTLNFKRGKKNYRFDVLHDIEGGGSSIDAALINWAARTETFTVESFCEYINSKGVHSAKPKQIEAIKHQSNGKV
jgi:hypothetical protein